MKPAFAIALALLIPAIAVPAQSARELKRELRTREKVAKKEKDPDKLCEVAVWASGKGLAADAKRIFNMVLRMNPDHEGANKGLGNALWDGKWMPKKKADGLRHKARVAEWKAKGFVEVDDVWVAPDEVVDAKRGVFHFEGDLVTKEEKLALIDGKVRHPDTGQLIDQENLVVAEQHYYPVGREGRWADQKAADMYYGDIAHPWIVRTTYGTMLTTMPMAKIQELKVHVDRGFERVHPVLGSKAPLPTNRPIVMVATTVDEYTQFGAQFGDATSSAPACLMNEEAKITIAFHNPARAAMVDASNKGLAPYYIRHGAALAYLQGKCEDAGATVPMWFQHGIGALASRFENDWDGAHFCRTGIVPRGGVKNIKGFINSFDINGDMESLAISYNVTFAGLLLHFATKGPNREVTDVMVSISDGFKNEDKDAVEKGVEKLTSALIDAEEQIIAFHQKLLADNR